MNSDFSEWHDKLISGLINGAYFDELYKILVDMKENKIDSQDAYSILESIKSSSELNLSENTEDTLLDLMDIAVGYCNFKYRIW
jgi:hypothetical protein